MALYLADPNATAAYRTAGFHCTAKSAGELGSRLLKKVRVARAVTEGHARLAARWEVTQDRVIEELASLGFSDIRKIFRRQDAEGPIGSFAELLQAPKRGDLLNPVDLDERTAVAVKSVEVVERPGLIDKKTIEIVHKITLHDKCAALVTLCRHLGLLHDKTEHSGTLDVYRVDETASDEELLGQVEAILEKARARKRAAEASL